MTKCPRCGCETFKIRQRYKGEFDFYFRPDGEELKDDYEDANSTMHDGAEYSEIWKYPRCAGCGKRIKEKK